MTYCSEFGSPVPRSVSHAACGRLPKVLDIGEHFFTRRKGYVTTFCDLKNHRINLERDRSGGCQKPRRLLSLMRRHRHNLKAEQQFRLMAYLAERPALELIYRFKQRLCYLLLKKHKNKRQCHQLIPRFLRAVIELRQSGLTQLVALGDTLHSWSEEIVRMWRFTRSNGITESFHNKMETISRQAYGFRNFENYRQRVQVLCS